MTWWQNPHSLFDLLFSSSSSSPLATGTINSVVYQMFMGDGGICIYTRSRYIWYIWFALDISNLDLLTLWQLVLLTLWCTRCLWEIEGSAFTQGEIKSLHFS